MELWILYAAVITLLFGGFYQECNAKTHFKYMTNYCSETVEVAASLVIVLAPSEVLQSDRSPDYFHCSVDLVAPEDARLHVHFLHLSISSDEKHTDRLKLYDMVPGRARIPITPAQGVYGMLDRSMLTSDESGSHVEEFTSSGRTMQVEYLGKPTQTHSGFRMLVTVVADKDTAGECPESTFNCPSQQWCVPSILLCDGYPNCGELGPADEDACHLHNLVSSVTYSLSEDIVLIIILPLFIFVLAVVLVMLTARWHVNKKHPPQVPRVKYINDGDGEVDLEGHATGGVLGAPPSYTEAVAHSQQPSSRFTAKPPSYNMLEELEREGIIVDSEDDEGIHHAQNHHHHHHHHHHHDDHQQHRYHPNQHYSPISRGHRVQERKSRDILTTSNSSIENIDDNRSHSSSNSRPIPRQHHLQQRQRRTSPRAVPPRDLDYSFSEDEETKKRTRKKGGKSKSKCKRRADDLCSPDTAVPECNNIPVPLSINTNDSSIAQRQHEQESSAACPANTSLPHSTSSSLFTSPLASPSSSNSVPFSSSSSAENTDKAIAQPLSTISSFSQIAMRHQKHSPNTTDTSVRPVAVLPLTSSTCVVVHANGATKDGNYDKKHHLYQKETALHSSDLSMSSGPEADKNNISETESVVLSMVDENNGRTESCASSNNSHNGDIPTKDQKKRESDKEKKRNQRVDRNRNVKKNNGKTSKKREITNKNNSGGKVVFGLTPFGTKVCGADGENDDDETGVRRELCEDADVSSDSDAGVKVDLRKQAVVSSQGRKKLLTKV